MESGISSKRLKVVWLCHFANQEVKDYFKTPHVNEMAPWISNLINLFRERKDIELHIVAPNIFNNSECNFDIDGIVYHFYKREPIPYNFSFFRKIHSFLRINERTNFYWIKHKIANCINKITPDIIHLHGAENPYYSAGVLPLLDKFPTLVTIQGFIRNTSYVNSIVKKRIKIETEILTKTKHIGVRTVEMSIIALQINPKAKLHFHNYPVSVPSVVKNNIGKTEPIDCLFFARISKDKGIEDLLAAISLVKNEYPSISLKVIGSANSAYLAYLKDLSLALCIENNVQFLGFINNQEAIYRYALQAKMCVLPTYHDIIPGTILESMFMKLPVIAYAVGGIPELNKDQETITLVEKQNINQLADKMLYLLNNPDKRYVLAELAYSAVNKIYIGNHLVADIIDAYNSIICGELSD